MPGADADEIDEIGDEVTARAQRLLKSARERRARAEDRGRANGLEKQIADVEEQTAIDLERNEQTLHELADIARRAEANGIIDADHA